MSPRIKVLSVTALVILAGAAVWYATIASNSRQIEAASSPDLEGPQQVSSGPTPSALQPAGSASAPGSAANRSVRVRQLSGRAYAVEDFGAIPSGTVDEVIAKLSPLALAGDATASHGIFLKLNECKDINRRASRGGALYAPDDVVAACIELSAENEVSSSRWLSLAAEQGNIGARLLYAADSESALGGAAALLRDPEGAKEYKQKAVGYLKEMASQGSADALLQLGNAYHAGVLVDGDLVSSRAYFEAVRLADPSIVPTQQVSSLDKALSAQQLSQALRKGNQIYDSCCR